MRFDIGIIGGGITGLAAAYYLKKAGVSSIALFEKAPRLGGKILTLIDKGFLVETGPDSFIIQKPHALDLINEIGLGEEVIAPVTTRFHMLHEGRLMTTPEGMRMLVPADREAFMRSPLFSEEGKQRILEESNVSPRPDDGDDESFADFIIRRFGEEMLTNYAGPLFTGIFSTPAEELSMKATFPMFLQLEQKHGSLTAASKAMQSDEGGSRSPFLSLQRGMGSLVDALIEQMDGVQLFLNHEITEVKEEANEYALSAKGIQYRCEKLILTLPTRSAADLLTGLSPEGAAALRDFSVGTSRILTLAFPKDAVQHLTGATGYISTWTSDGMISASTWSSEKWEGRAPDDMFLARFFFGNPDHPALQHPDWEEQAIAEIQQTLQIDAQPLHGWVHFWPSSLPQYKIGHAYRVQRVKEYFSRHPNLVIAGCAFEGVGIPDCIRQGKEAAERLM